MMQKFAFLLTVAALAAIYLGCNKQAPRNSFESNGSFFPKEDPAPAEFFTGNAWVHGLVADDSTFSTSAGNVMFDAGARSNRHSHPSGQLSLVTAGKDFHQIKDRPEQGIGKDDVVECPAGQAHWHGASADSGMTHIYIVPNTEKGIVNWLVAGV